MIAAVKLPVAAANVIAQVFAGFGINITGKCFVAVLALRAFKSAVRPAVGL